MPNGRYGNYRWNFLIAEQWYRDVEYVAHGRATTCRGVMACVVRAAERGDTLYLWPRAGDIVDGPPVLHPLPIDVAVVADPEGEQITPLEFLAASHGLTEKQSVEWWFAIRAEYQGKREAALREAARHSALARLFRTLPDSLVAHMDNADNVRDAQ